MTTTTQVSSLFAKLRISLSRYESTLKLAGRIHWNQAKDVAKIVAVTNVDRSSAMDLRQIPTSLNSTLSSLEEFLNPTNRLLESSRVLLRNPHHQRYSAIPQLDSQLPVAYRVPVLGKDCDLSLNSAGNPDFGIQTLRFKGALSRALQISSKNFTQEVSEIFRVQITINHATNAANK